MRRRWGRLLTSAAPPLIDSMLALSWPSLDSLSLSIMTKPEVAPEALGLLDNFRSLKRLSLFAPLDYEA